MSVDSLGFSPHFLDLVTAIALRLHNDPDLDSILCTTVHELRKLLHVKRVVIVQIYTDHRAEIVAECSDLLKTSSEKPIFSVPACVQQWTQDLLTTYIISDRSLDALPICGKQLLSWLDVHQGILAPIYLQADWPETASWCSPEPGDALWGFLVVDHDPGTQGWSPIEVSFVRQLAQHLFHSICQTQLRQFSNRLIESLQDGVVAIDRQQRYQVWNRAMEELTGVPRRQVLGHRAWDVFPFLRESGEHQCMEAAIAGETVVSRDRTFQVPQSGRTFFFEARYSPLMDPSNQIVGCLGVIRDISQQKQSEDYLKTVTSRLSVLIQNLQVGILLEDETRTSLLSNAAFCQMFAVPGTPQDLIRQDYSQMAMHTQHLLHDPEATVQRIERILGDRIPVMGDEVHLNDGRILERDYIPIFVEGDYRGHLWQYRDISQLKQIQQQLEQARLSAEAANRAKSNFLATMSHEIRTPLNAVIGLAELLASTPLNSEQQEYIDIIRNSSAMLLSLINDILDISKIEAQKLDLEQEPFDLHHCLNDTLKLMAPLAAEKNLALRSHLSLDVPQYIVGDTMRLRQILVNLINNAIKFTQQGHVDVEVMVQKMNPLPHSDVELYFTVRDTGVGIPAECQEQLFEAFQQLDASVTRRYGGSGLGLTICKSLVEAMGGQITVTSEPGQGSTFAFTIQALAIAAQPDSKPHTTPLVPEMTLGNRPLPSTAPRPKILVVDDLVVNQKVAVKMLENLGYEADSASQGLEAIAALHHTPYDVILMDIQMPEMDGHEATRTIRAMASTLHQPWIIAMTAHSQVEDRHHSLQAGMNDYLSKPILPKDLTAALHRYSQSLPTPFPPHAAGFQPASIPPVSHSPLAQPPPPLLDEAVLEDLCALVGPDRSIIADLLQSYHQESQTHLNALQNAIYQTNGDLIKRHAHALRSMSLNLGAIALADLCRDLEMHYSQQSQTQQLDHYQRIASLLPHIHYALDHHPRLQSHADEPS